jgi:hypothetical protein
VCDEVVRFLVQHAAFFTCAEATMKHSNLLIRLPMLLVVWPALRMRRNARGQSQFPR